MTKADHHHPDCLARQRTDDDCNCSWLVEPRLPLEHRYMLRDKLPSDDLDNTQSSGRFGGKGNNLQFGPRPPGGFK